MEEFCVKPRRPLKLITINQSPIPYTNQLFGNIYYMYYSNIFATHEFSIILEPIIINLEQLVVLECLECRLTTRDENQVFVETLVWTLRIITYVYLKGLCIAKIKIYIFFSCLPGN